MTNFVVHVGVECIQCSKSMQQTKVMDDQVLTCPDRECGMFGRFFQLPTVELEPWPAPVDGVMARSGEKQISVDVIHGQGERIQGLEARLARIREALLRKDSELNSFSVLINAADHAELLKLTEPS